MITKEIKKSALRLLADNLNYDYTSTASVGGYTFTLSTEPDDATAINDFDCYGRIEWAGRDGMLQRPDGFNGAAMKLRTQHDTFWWQPPDAPHFPAMNMAVLNIVKEILEFGFSTLILTVTTDCECCGQSKFVASAAISGLEPFTSDEDILLLAEDLLSEID